MKIIEFFAAKNGRLFPTVEECLSYEARLGDSESPYIYKPFTSQEAYYNPKYDSNAPCQCGHPYYRHFDSYEDNAPVGCKYCDCYEFVLDTSHHNHSESCSH